MRITADQAAQILGVRQQRIAGWLRRGVHIPSAEQIGKGKKRTKYTFDAKALRDWKKDPDFHTLAARKKIIVVHPNGTSQHVPPQLAREPLREPEAPSMKHGILSRLDRIEDKLDRLLRVWA
jgi:hypothetical protein